MAKTKALISFGVTAKLICTFVFAHAYCWFSHVAAHILTEIIFHVQINSQGHVSIVSCPNHTETGQAFFNQIGTRVTRLCTGALSTLLTLRKHAHVIYRFFLIENFWYKMFVIFLIFAQNIDCGYMLEPPRRGGSNEYPQSMFCSKNKN